MLSARTSRAWMNRVIKYRVPPAVYVSPNSTRLLLGIDTVPYERPVMLFSRPYHLRRPIQISPPSPSSSRRWVLLHFVDRWFLDLSKRHMPASRTASCKNYASASVKWQITYSILYVVSIFNNATTWNAAQCNAQWYIFIAIKSRFRNFFYIFQAFH